MTQIKEIETQQRDIILLYESIAKCLTPEDLKNLAYEFIRNLERGPKE